MTMERLGVLLVLALNLYAVSPQTLESSGTAEVRVGETAILTCRVTDFKYISQQLKFAKVDNKDPLLTKEISSHISVSYNADRYTVDAVEDNGVFTYTLTITDIQPSDDGSYKCFVEDKDDAIITEVKETLTVIQPVKSVELQVDSFKANDGQPPKEHELEKFNPNLVIMCKVRGGNPAPKVMVKVGDLDITSKLKPEFKPIIKGPTFESIRSYNADLDSTGKYSLDTSVLNQVISCSAWLPGDEKKVASMLLKVKEPPKVECSNVTARLGDRRVTLQCTIKSLTTPEQITWFIDSESPKFIPITDEQVDEYRATQTDTTKNSVTVSLEIGLVEEKHFDTIYELRAKVSQSDLSHTVRLKPSPNTGGSTGGQGRITMATSLMASLVLVGGLLKRLM